jgi:nitrite reductase/ring-hydroxylating ferredoxin subunit
MERLGSAEALDAPARVVASKVREAGSAAPAVKDALSGTWLGHSLHPLLQLAPLGTWLSAVVLDWVGGAGSEQAAERLLAVGLLGAVPTAASGATDYSDTVALDDVRRLGFVHAASNLSGMALFGASLSARRRGSRGTGKLLALAGLGAVGVGGYLGGHLTYAEGVGVNVATFEDYPQDWTAVLADAAIGEGEMRAVDVDGVSILVARRGGEIFALSNTCVHRGGQLDQGELEGDCVKCPLHGSVFRLEDGSVEQGPAAFPQPALESRVNDGSIEVRAPQRP